nr:hypothetical protein [Deltaproteobacteria bacterium]
ALLGIALGVAMLVKLQVIFFLSGPFLYYLNNSIKCARRANYTQLRNALLTLLIALFISISWWGNKLGDISRDFFNHAFALYPYFSGVVPEVLGNQVIPVFSFDSMKFYFVSLINHVSLPLFTVFVLALYFFVNSRERSRALFLTGLVIPMVIFTFISVKWARYILPLIIPMSLISAWAIDKIMNNFLKRLTLTYVITYCICLYMTTTWMLPYYLLPGIIWPKSWVERPLAEPNRQYQHLSKMEAKGVLHAIETKLGDNQEVKILYSADSVPLILQIYLYFQQHSSIYRLNMRRDDDLKIRDDDFILIKKNEWINNSSSYNKYRVLAEINKHAIYVKK